MFIYRIGGSSHTCVDRLVLFCSRNLSFQFIFTRTGRVNVPTSQVNHIDCEPLMDIVKEFNMGTWQYEHCPRGDNVSFYILRHIAISFHFDINISIEYRHRKRSKIFVSVTIYRNLRECHEILQTVTNPHPWASFKYGNSPLSVNVYHLEFNQIPLQTFPSQVGLIQ